MELSESDFGSTRELGAGEALLLRLPENPTTGYRWQVAQTGDGELELVEDRFESAAGPKAAVGAAGERLLRFVGKRAGRVELTARQGRAWEAATAAGKSLSVVVR